MFVEVMELRRARRRALESRTLPGHAKNLLGYCFSAYCLYRCGRGPAPLPALPYPTKNLLGHCFSAYCPHRRGRGHAPARPRPPGAPGPPALCALCAVLSLRGTNACCVVRPVLRAQAQRAGARAGQDVLGGARARAGRGPALGPGQHRARPGPGRLHARPPGHQRAAAVAGAPGVMACMQAPHAAGGGGDVSTLRCGDGGATNEVGLSRRMRGLLVRGSWPARAVPHPHLHRLHQHQLAARVPAQHAPGARPRLPQAARVWRLHAHHSAGLVSAACMRCVVCGPGVLFRRA